MLTYTWEKINDGVSSFIQLCTCTHANNTQESKLHFKILSDKSNKTSCVFSFWDKMEHGNN